MKGTKLLVLASAAFAVFGGGSAFAEGIIASGNFNGGSGPAFGYGYSYGNGVVSTNALSPTGGVDGTPGYQVTSDAPPGEQTPEWWGWGGGVGWQSFQTGAAGFQNLPTVAFGLQPDKFYYEFDALFIGAVPTRQFVEIDVQLQFIVPFEAIPNDPPDGDLSRDDVGAISITNTQYNVAQGGFQRISGSFAGGAYGGVTSEATLAQFLNAVNQIQLNLNLPNGDTNFGRDGVNTFIFDNVTISQGPIAQPAVAGDFGGAESPDGSLNTPDGAFNEFDVEGFLLALNDQAAYLVLNPTLGDSLTGRGDFGGADSTDGSLNTPDGAFNEFDVEGFLLALNDPAGYAAIQPAPRVAPIPEPAALGLLAPMGLLMARRRR